MSLVWTEVAPLALTKVREPVQVVLGFQMSGSVRLPESGLARLAQSAGRIRRAVVNRINMVSGFRFQRAGDRQIQVTSGNFRPGVDARRGSILRPGPCPI